MKTSKAFQSWASVSASCTINRKVVRKSSRSPLWYLDNSPDPTVFKVAWRQRLKTSQRFRSRDCLSNWSHIYPDTLGPSDTKPWCMPLSGTTVNKSILDYFAVGWCCGPGIPTQFRNVLGGALQKANPSDALAVMRVCFDRP